MVGPALAGLNLRVVRGKSLAFENCVWPEPNVSL